MNIVKAKNYHWHTLSPEKVAEILKTDPKEGLSEKEVEIRQKKFGLNKLPEEKPLPKVKIFLSQFQSPLVYILVIAGIVTLVLWRLTGRDWTDTIIIFAVVFLITIFGYFQENKASNALRELKKVLKVRATILREGGRKEIFQENLVSGDIIILKAGDKVPSDGRIIESSNLKISEASLTGEWLAADKIVEILPRDTPLADRDNMVYMGTIVEDGEGKAIITEIGAQTEIGKVAVLIKETKEEKTPYQKKLAHFSKIVALLVGFISLSIFIVGIATGKEFVEMFITAIAVAVAAIPEGLPVAMTVILALGMQRILKRKGLVRKLASAETLGSTSIIATDKTLTLTQGKMEVAEVRAEDKNLALKIAVLCSEAFIENPQDLKPFWRVRGRPTDKALLLAGEEEGLRKLQLEKEFPEIDEIPFNSQNKFIATLHQTKEGKVLFVSGAPEKIIELSLTDENTRSKLNQDLEDLTSKGLRVIAFGYKKTKETKLKIEDISDLTFVGFIGLKDPLRKEVKEAIKICQKAGMKPIIVTGDHVLTAKAVAKELGLAVKKENIIEGKELDNISDKELEKKLDKINVFARVEPRHKIRIIGAWQAKNQVVAMTGDGINDAPALKKADIGIALGSGTEVAKEVSDLVLLNDSFSIIVAAIEEGRVILDNIRKVITYLLSSSFTEVILIGVSIVAKLPLPIIAVQILWVNLMTDGLPSVALAYEPKEKDLMTQKPVSRKASLLTREMKIIIFIIGIFTDLILLGLFFWLYNKFGKENLIYVQTMIFACLGSNSLFYVFSCKSLRKNIWHINLFNNKVLLLGCLVGFLALVAALYLPVLQNVLKTVPLGFFDWLIIIGLGLINIAAIEAAKWYFIAKRKNNLKNNN